MRRLLSLVLNAPKVIRTMWLAVSPLKFKNTPLLLCTSSFQGDSLCNGTHSKKELLPDPQLFEAQFEELVTELSEKDITDPALADALNRLREVRMSSFLLLSLTKCRPAVSCSDRLHLFSRRCWCTIPQEGRGTEACL